MAPLFRGRYTAHIDGPFVVFVIGIRINQPWKVHRWLPVLLAMQPMLVELYGHPEKGFLSGEFFLGRGGPVLLQYWRSFEHLDAFARHTGDPHLAAWQRFNRRIGAGGSVGIFHETYLVEPGRYESVYANMPRFGLASAAEHMPAVGSYATARRRLGSTTDEPPVPISS